MFRMHRGTAAGEIELSWIPLHGVFEIRVVRKAGSPPAGPRDGERVAAPLTSADSDLREGQVYYYAIYAIYRMADRGDSLTGHRCGCVSPLATSTMNAPRLRSHRAGRLGWIGPNPRDVRCGSPTTKPLPASPGAQLSVAGAEQFAGDRLRSRAPTRPRTPILWQSASATTRLWSWSEACSPSATRPGSRGWWIPRTPSHQDRRTG